MTDTLTNKYALAGLRERRAEMAGEIVTIERRLRYLRETIVNVYATIRLFAPDHDPEATPVKVPCKRAKLFGAGGLNRMILDTLRRAGRQMSCGEVVDAVSAEAGFGDDAKAGMSHRVRAALAYPAEERGLVVEEGERAEARWVLAPD